MFETADCIVRGGKLTTEFDAKVYVMEKGHIVIEPQKTEESEKKKDESSYQEHMGIGEDLLHLNKNCLNKGYP